MHRPAPKLEDQPGPVLLPKEKRPALTLGGQVADAYVNNLLAEIDKPGKRTRAAKSKKTNRNATRQKEQTKHQKQSSDSTAKAKRPRKPLREAMGAKVPTRNA